MHLNLRNTSLALVVFSRTVLAPSAAQSSQTQSRTVRTGSDYSRPSGFGLNLFIAGDGAFIRSSSNSQDESSKQGALYGGKALLTLVNRDVEIEGGAGYCISNLQGAADTVEDEQNGGLVRLENVKIQTQTAVAEFSARLRLNQSTEGDGIWSIGPTAAACWEQTLPSDLTQRKFTVL